MRISRRQGILLLPGQSHQNIFPCYAGLPFIAILRKTLRKSLRKSNRALLQIMRSCSMRLDTRTFELTLLVDSMIGRTLCYRKLLLLLSTTRQGRLCLGTRA